MIFYYDSHSAIIVTEREVLLEPNYNEHHKVKGSDEVASLPEVLTVVSCWALRALTVGSNIIHTLPTNSDSHDHHCESKCRLRVLSP